MSRDSSDIAGYIMGQAAGNLRASNAEIAAQSARADADSARIHAETIGLWAEVERTHRNQQIQALESQIAAWRARFERERSARRGWQQDGMAARALIEKLANVDRAGAQKLIDQSYEDNKAMIDASKQKVNEWNFTGVEPGKT